MHLRSETQIETETETYLRSRMHMSVSGVCQRVCVCESAIYRRGGAHLSERVLAYAECACVSHELLIHVSRTVYISCPRESVCVSQQFTDVAAHTSQKGCLRKQMSDVSVCNCRNAYANALYALI